MSIDTGQAPLKFVANYPVPGVSQTSQQFRDNFAITQTAIENIQGITRDDTSLLDVAIYQSPSAGTLTFAVAPIDPRTPPARLPKGALSYQNNALYYWNGTGWAPVAAGAASLPGPKGAKGDTGCKGDTGATGPRGPQGAQGPIGYNGESGRIGPVGPQGPIGSEGRKGEQGDRGPAGPVGPQGPAGALAYFNLTAFPTAPFEGETFYHSVNKRVYTWDGTQWQAHW